MVKNGVKKKLSDITEKRNGSLCNAMTYTGFTCLFFCKACDSVTEIMKL